MSSTTDISNNYINSGENQSTSFISNIQSYFISMIYVFLHIIIHFIFGSFILYGCKLAQSNILPTDVDCFPYTENNPDIKPIQTNIFTTWTDPPLSNKLSFPYNDGNKKNIIIDILRKYKLKSTTGNIGNYFVSIFESLFSLNYTYWSLFLNAMNYFPEMLIILIGPVIAPIVTIFFFILEIFYFFYIWFSNFSWFFKENVADDDSSPPKWKSISLLEKPLDFYFSTLYCTAFIILFFVLLFIFPFILFLIPIIPLLWSSFSLLTYESVLNNNPIGLATIIKEVFKYYKITFMVIFSYYAISNAFTQFGVGPGIACLLVILLIIFGIIKMNVYKDKPETNLSPVVPTEQATRNCSSVLKKGGKIINNIIQTQNSNNKFLKNLKNTSKNVQENLSNNNINAQNNTNA